MIGLLQEIKFRKEVEQNAIREREIERGWIVYSYHSYPLPLQWKVLLY